MGVEDIGIRHSEQYKPADNMFQLNNCPNSLNLIKKKKKAANRNCPFSRTATSLCDFFFSLFLGLISVFFAVFGKYMPHSYRLNFFSLYILYRKQSYQDFICYIYTCILRHLKYFGKSNSSLMLWQSLKNTSFISLCQRCRNVNHATVFESACHRIEMVEFEVQSTLDFSDPN